MNTKLLYGNFLRKMMVLALFAGFFGGSLYAQHGADHAEHAVSEHTGAHEAGESEIAKDEEDMSQVIIHHVMDSHDWHIADLPGGSSIALHMPWILYNSETGIEFYGSTHSLLESGKYGMDHSGNVVYLANPEASVLDFSLTKTGLHVLIVCLLMFIVFRAVARAYKKREGQAPKGLQGFMEVIILFVRDDVARPFLGKHADRFLPYLLTLFFFIWFSNMFGLTPLSSNIAGNTSITAMLALLTLILILVNSTKDFWLHIFWFPGVPIWLKPLMFVVEFMGLLTKPFALAIRLFANIAAGHFMTLALIGLIFILGDNGKSVGGALGVAPLSIGFTLFIFTLELLVALVQAFVFTLLTAVFIAQAMESHDHEHEHEHEHAHAGH